MVFNKTACMTILRRMLVVTILLLTPVIVLAATDGHQVDSGVLAKDFAYRIFNFALMVGLLVYFLKKPIRNGLRNRREEIEKTLQEAQAAKAAAEAKYQEYSEKLEKATEEIAAISQSILREGEHERDKILATAREMSVKIQQEADAKAANAVANAKTELREEAARLAVELAEDLLKRDFSAQDQKRLVEEYMQKVGDLH